MERINMLLQKISAIVENGRKNTEIDIDLALDYTRVLYADLMEIRNKMTVIISPVQEPTLAELTEAMKPIEDKKTPEYVAQQEPKQTAPVAQPLKFTSRNDIRNFIGINDKYQFISELFGNDKERYEHMLDEINSIWDEENARDLLKKHAQYVTNWNEDNETIILFYSLLNKFFSTI